MDIKIKADDQEDINFVAVSNYANVVKVETDGIRAVKQEIKHADSNEHLLYIKQEYIEATDESLSSVASNSCVLQLADEIKPSCSTNDSSKCSQEVPLTCDSNEFITATKFKLAKYIDTNETNKTGNLTRHVYVHKRVNVFECGLCDFKTAMKHSLQKHHMTVHTQENPFACSVCEFRSVNEHRLRKHMSIHTGAKSFACSLCDFRTALKDSLQKHHTRVHTQEKPYACTLCEFRGVEKQDLRRHMYIHTGEKPYECNLCHFKATKQQYLRRHVMSVHTGERPFVCSLCDFKTVDKNGLKVHMFKHTDKKSYECNLCQFKTKAKYSLQRHHKRVHAGEKPVVLSVGSLVDIKQEAIEIKDEPLSTATSYNCFVQNVDVKIPSCSSTSPTMRNRKPNTKDDLGRPQFSCHMCGFKTTLKNTLQRHCMRLHGREKPFACTLCEYKAVERKDLTKHMYIHTGEKPVQCTLCEFRSTKKQYLQRHTMSVHTGERPFVCNICEYKSVDKNGLRRHMYVHTNEKSFQCNFCDFKTKTKNFLQRHQRRMHINSIK